MVKNHMKESLSESYSAIYQNEVVELERLHIRWPRHREEALIKWAGSGNRLLEIGFGKGTVLYNLHEHFDQLYGVELSSLRVQKAQDAFKKTGITNIHLSTGNVEEGLPFEDGYFDCIIWADVIEHVIDLWTAMEEVRWLLGPKGRLITSTPNVAKLRRRLLLMTGTFPSTSAKNEGLNVRAGELFDGGHMHYFTFSSLEKLYRKYRIQPTKRYGFGEVGRLHNVHPSLLSGSVFMVGEKI